MKKAILVCALAAIMLLGVASLAVASQGDSTYLAFSGGTSPHGGYTTTSQYCGVCHAVHNAASGGEALLQSSRDDACTYCHITDNISSLMPYATEAEYTTASDTAHDTDGGVGCKDCHQVHGALDMMFTDSAYLTEKILKIVDSGFAGGGVTVDDTQMGVLGADDNTDESMWCSQCHQYYVTANDGVSHVMTDDTTGVTATDAFSASSYCISCHSATTGTTGVTQAFPHKTDAVRFLEVAGADAGGNSANADATDGADDGVCIRCHRDGLGSGVGMDF